MKKLLLTLCALFALTGMYAQYQYNDYIFTANARYKVTELIDITQPGSGWNNYSGEFFSPYTAETEDDYDGIMSTNSDEGSFISYALPLEYGTNYIVTMKVLASADGASSITNATLNQIDAWTSPTDDKGVRPGTAGIDHQQVATTATLKANEWVEISWFFADTLAVNADADGGYLNILISRLNTESVIATNMQVVKVVQVYDTRISDKKIEYARQILEDENFNVEEAAEKRDLLEDAIKTVEDASHDAEGTFDDQAAAEEYVSSLDEFLADYMDVASTNMQSYLSYIDITSIPALGRGRINKAYGCFPALNGNWGHLDGTDYLMSAIQQSYEHTAQLNIVNTDFPAGKYFFTAELRNATTDKTSWPCNLYYTLETTPTMTIGETVVNAGPISGEQFQKFYIIGDITEDGAFKATIDWPVSQTVTGGAFQVRALEVRSFGDVEAKIRRTQIWNSFIAQWNAAVSARNNVLSIKDNENYPWAQDSLQNALTNWDPYYNQVVAAGWVDENGNDTGVATDEELTEWTTYQGVELYAEDEVTRLEYQLVRNYQWAYNYVVAQNKLVTDLQTAIDEAKKTNDDPMNVNGDHEAFLDVINAAQTLHDAIIQSTTDEAMEADQQRLQEAIDNLAEATEAFKASAILTPIVDIDFSGSFEPVLNEEDPDIIDAYVINGKSETYPDGVGQMSFPTTSVQTDPTVEGHYYQLGYGDVLLDVLRVGSAEATVTLDAADIPTDNDIMRVEFDLWLGNLGKGYMTVEMRNADNQRIGGFSIDRYNGAVAYNDFNNEANTGLNIASYASGLGSNSVANAAICVDANKSSFTLIYDFKAKALQGKIINGKNGTNEGVETSMLDVTDETLTDNKPAKFVITSNYSSANANAPTRRCWFDNLKIYKYKSIADGPHFTNHKKGDVNEDDVVDINDVVAIINHMAGTATYKYANVNEDKDDAGNDVVDINDVVAVINIMAGNAQ